MARTATMATMLADLRWRADIESMTARHTDAMLARILNQSWQAYRVRVSDSGGGLYLKATTPAAMTAGALAGYAFGTIAHPSDAIGIYGVDVTATSGDIRSLAPGSFGQRNAYFDRWNGCTGFPELYFPYNIGTESTTGVTAGKIAIFPAPADGYTYSIWYLPAWTDIGYTSTTYVFDGYAGCEEWVILDCVAKIATRDNDMQQCAALATQERAKCWEEQILPAIRIQQSGPRGRIDSAEMERAQKGRRW